MSDEIVLTLPRDRDFYDVAHLVVGGLAVRLNLTIEHLEDLQLALDGLLPQDERAGDVTVVLRLEDEAITARIGPFERDALQRELDRDEEGRPGLARVLKTVSDSYEVEDEGGSAWVVLRKGVA